MAEQVVGSLGSARVLKGRDAYDYAVSQGYTGTEEEYSQDCAKIGKYADVQEAAESAAASAASAASSAAAAEAASAETQYAVCSTAAETAEKTVTCGSAFYLEPGATVKVKFAYENTASNPTLNVNGTGAKAIYAYGTTAADPYIWAPGAVAVFIYDGTSWIMPGGTPASMTHYGLTRLSDATDSTSTTLAATASAVKAAYDLANEANTAAASSAKIATGSYVGTGTYGSANPCSLTFGFVPKLIIISSGYSNELIWKHGTDYAGSKTVTRVDENKVSLIGTTIKWYLTGSYALASGTVSSGTMSAAYQMNASNTTYTYICLGQTV